jgi:hypothetical protein
MTPGESTSLGVGISHNAPPTRRTSSHSECLAPSSERQHCSENISLHLTLQFHALSVTLLRDQALEYRPQKPHAPTISGAANGQKYQRRESLRRSRYAAVTFLQTSKRGRSEINRLLGPLPGKDQYPFLGPKGHDH